MESNWEEKSNCRGSRTAIFFEEFEEASLSDKLNIMVVCVDCPVYDSCKEFAESFPNTEGFYAGKFYRMGVAKDPIRVRPVRNTAPKLVKN